MSTEETYAIIEQYLDGKLRGQALKEFEQRIEEDPALADVVELMRDMDRIIEACGDVSGTGKPTIIQRSPRVAAGSRVFSLKKFFVAGGATLALLLIALLIFQQVVSLFPGQLFADHFTPFPAPVLTGDASNDATWQAALTAYRNGDYETAVLKLEKRTETPEPSGETARFLLGVSYLATDNHQPLDAVPLLEQVAAQRGYFHEQARWYLALAYLKAADRPKAIETLEQIAGMPDHYQEAESREIREQLSETTYLPW